MDVFPPGPGFRAFVPTGIVGRIWEILALLSCRVTLMFSNATPQLNAMEVEPKAPFPGTVWGLWVKPLLHSRSNDPDKPQLGCSDLQNSSRVFAAGAKRWFVGGSWKVLEVGGASRGVSPSSPQGPTLSLLCFLWRQ